MSDYIENQEYSMQLAAPGDDPSAYDWTRLQEEVDGATSSWFGDITLASLQEPMDVDNVDLTGLHDALENGPWRDYFGCDTKDQGMDAQPGDRPSTYFSHHSRMDSRMEIGSDLQEPIPDDDAQFSGTAADVDPKLPCDHPKCGKAFKRKGDLTRHKKLHNRDRRFVCTAQGCRFSFTRNDKLLDHARAGHDFETLFACHGPGCSVLLTKDILPLHGLWHNDYSNLNSFRQCPLPKCGFRTRSKLHKLDEMQKHLLKSHDQKGRKQFASLLASRGYDYESANLLCPICPDTCLLEGHKEFSFHFLAKHCPDCVFNQSYRGEPQVSWASRTGHYGRQWGPTTDEQRKHRRTILSLFPDFKSHPVWRDIEFCTSRGS